jgi:hypothetical protein
MSKKSEIIAKLLQDDSISVYAKSNKLNAILDEFKGTYAAKYFLEAMCRIDPNQTVLDAFEWFGTSNECDKFRAQVTELKLPKIEANSWCNFSLGERFLYKDKITMKQLIEQWKKTSGFDDPVAKAIIEIATFCDNLKRRQGELVEKLDSLSDKFSDLESSVGRCTSDVTSLERRADRLESDVQYLERK